MAWLQGSAHNPRPRQDLLLEANLPVELMGDRSPVDLPPVQAVVHTPEDDCPSILRTLLAAGGKGKGESGSGCEKGLPW